MAEKALSVLLETVSEGFSVFDLKSIPQTAYITESNVFPNQDIWTDVEISSFEKCKKDKLSYAKNFKIIEQESNKMTARRILQRTGNNYIVVNPPFSPMTGDELDNSFDLPFTRLPHPKYNKRGTIPAWEMIKFSVNMHRGCFGGCSVCTISAHQ